MTVWRFVNALRYPGWSKGAIGQFLSFWESFSILLLSSEMLLLTCTTYHFGM
jgi:hypothetical protein